MEVAITGKKENRAMQRQEVEFEAKDANITPARKELRPKLAAMLGAKESLTVIKSINHRFGERSATIRANVYESEAAMKKAEPAHLIARDTGVKVEKKKKGAKQDGKKGAKKGGGK
jgi:ribosomal protein S24E